MCNPPTLGIKPMPPALAGGFLTTGPAGIFKRAAFVGLFARFGGGFVGPIQSLKFLVFLDQSTFWDSFMEIKIQIWVKSLTPNAQLLEG